MSRRIESQRDQWPHRVSQVPQEYRDKGVDFDQPEDPEIDYLNRAQQTKHYIQDRYPDLVGGTKENYTHDPSHGDDPDFDPDFADNILMRKHHSQPAPSADDFADWSNRRQQWTKEHTVPAGSQDWPPPKLWSEESERWQPATTDSRGMTSPGGEAWVEQARANAARGRARAGKRDDWSSANVVRNDEVRIMHPEETGLEYSVIAKPNPKGDGYDVISPLD